MSLRQRKKLQNENLLPNQSDESDESEITTRKGNNFELVSEIKNFCLWPCFYFEILRKKKINCEFKAFSIGKGR